MSKLLALDLDGTLFYPHRFFRCVPKKNVKFLRKWIDAGNEVVLVSSRGPETMEKIKEEIDRDVDFISYTSSYIVAKGEVIKDEPVKNDLAELVVAMIEKEHNPIAILGNFGGRPLAIKSVKGAGKILLGLYWLYWFFQGKKHEKYILNNKVFDEYLKHDNVYKVMVFFGFSKKGKNYAKNINKEIRETIPQIESSWAGPTIEVTPQNCSKGKGLEYYCEHLGINKKDVYVVGDSGNDINMFKLFNENSYVMKHAYPSVKKHAKHVISRVYKLDKILLNKEGD